MNLHPIHRPLIPVALAVIAGVACGVWMPGYTHWVVGGALAVFLGCAACRVCRRGVLALPLLLCMMAGYLSIQPWLSPDLPQHHVLHFCDAGKWRLSGKIVDAPRKKHRRVQWVVAASRLERDGKSYPVCGRVKVSARDVSFQISRGDRVSFSGRLREIRSFTNPGGFDYRRYLALKAIHVRSYARSGTLHIEPSDAGLLLRRADTLRRRLSRGLDDALSRHPHKIRALLQVLLLGDRSQLTEQMRDRFNRAGVGHVLAISGLHIGMVAAMAFALSRWALALIPQVRRNAWTRRVAALGSLAAVAGYGVLAGLSPSTQRAMIMVAAFMAAYWVGRRHDWLNALALAALVILVVYPPALLSISFQLSFAAVLAIVMGFGRPADAPGRPDAGIRYRFGKRVAAMMQVSLLAILGTLPLVLYYFNQISTVGLVTNLIVVPVVGLVVVPAGLLGVGWFSLDPEIAALFWHVAAWGMQAVHWLVEQVARWPWSAVKTVTPSVFEILLYYGAFGLLRYWRSLPMKRLALILLLVFWLADGAYWYHRRFHGRQMTVTALDVGQGSANLLELPGGYTVLVDGGGFSDNRYFDVGRRIIAPLLWRRKIRTVDLVVLSHPNSDHLNGLLYILEHFHVERVWHNGESANTLGYRRFKRIIDRREIDVPEFQRVPRRREFGGVTFELLAPPVDFLSRSGSGKRHDANNNSIVLAVEYNGVRMMLPGDIGSATEAGLLQAHDPGRLRCDILMAPHHGSEKSGTLAFLNAVRPTETIISAGWMNRFGLPHPLFLHRLNVVGSRVWNTASHGAVRVVIDDGGYRINGCR